MATVTKRTMNIIVTLLTTLLCFTGLQACEDGEVKPEVEKAVYFEMPEGWGVDLERGRAENFYEYPDEGRYSFYLQVSIHQATGKTDEDAKRSAQTFASGRECVLSPGAFEKEIAGKKVYIVRDKGCSFYANSSPYGTNLYFEKNGHVVVLIMTEDYNHFEPDIEMFMRTFRMNY